MAVPLNDCAGMGDMSWFPHRCDVQRMVLTYDVTNIIDRKISSYTTLQSSQPCWFEHQGGLMIENPQLGRQHVDRYTVWFSSYTDVLPGDRLLKDSIYYFVEDYFSAVDEGFGKRVTVRKLGYAAQ